MKTQTIKANHPILYQIVKNALERQKMPHAYLLVGNESLLEIALWMSGVRVHKTLDDTAIDGWLEDYFNYGNEDIIVLDGSSQSIKKEAMTQALQQLNLTSKQVDGFKTLIVHQVDNATLASMNSFLKGLEEPSSNAVSFILTTSNLDQVLDTIVSRCLVVNLANTTTTQDTTIDETVQTWVDEFVEMLKLSIDRGIVELQLLNISDRNQLEAFFMHLYRYAQKLAIEKRSYQKLAAVSIEMASKINRSVNTQLLVDEFGYRLKEELQ